MQQFYLYIISRLSRTRGSFSDENLAKSHDEKSNRKSTSTITANPHKTFSSEPILPIGHIS